MLLCMVFISTLPILVFSIGQLKIKQGLANVFSLHSIKVSQPDQWTHACMCHKQNFSPDTHNTTKSCKDRERGTGEMATWSRTLWAERFASWIVPFLKIFFPQQICITKSPNMRKRGTNSLFGQCPNQHFSSRLLLKWINEIVTYFQVTFCPEYPLQNRQPCHYLTLEVILTKCGMTK